MLTNLTNLTNLLLEILATLQFYEPSTQGIVFAAMDEDKTYLEKIWQILEMEKCIYQDGTLYRLTDKGSRVLQKYRDAEETKAELGA